MKKYLVSAITWGSLFAGDCEIEAENRQQALKQFCKREGFNDHRVVYDSKKNTHLDRSRVVSIIEGYFSDENRNNMFVSGRRGYYKIIPK